MEHLVSGALALGLSLQPAQVLLFQRYADELAAWNSRLSLTAITSPKDVQVKHFLDSLTCLQAIPPGFSVKRLLDVGSGAGFPGVPLKIYCPEVQLTLMEATSKKAEFLRQLVDVLGLQRVEVVADRAETLGQQAAYREQFDLVVARAVAEMAVLAELCLPFCRVGGLFVAQKKAGILAEMRAATGALEELGGQLQAVVPVHLPGVEPRQLLVVRKVAATPARYPRRPGMPAKRPLA
jgi:16S rRNA (guanine527-N7)-methyltransferase